MSHWVFDNQFKSLYPLWLRGNYSLLVVGEPDDSAEEGAALRRRARGACCD